MKRSWALPALLLALGSLTPLPAAAGDSFGTRCRVAFSGANLVYDPFATQPTTAIGTVDLECEGASGQIVVTIDALPGSSGSYAQRTMENAHRDTLSYNLYYDGSGTVFGDGRGGTAHYQRVLTAERGRASDSFSVQLVVPPHQDAGNGAYSDSLALDVEL